MGDNLGLNSLLGLTVSFASNFPCRFCKIIKRQRSLASLEGEYYLRTRKSYDRDLKINNLSSTGIKDEYVFDNICGYHVTKNKSCDGMHDCSEGSCCNDMPVLIQYCIENFSH